LSTCSYCVLTVPDNTPDLANYQKESSNSSNIWHNLIVAPAKPLKTERQQLTDALKTAETLTESKSEERWRNSVSLQGANKKIEVRAQNDHTEARVLVDSGAGKLLTAVPHRAFRKSIEAFTSASVELSAEEDKLITEHGHRRLSLEHTDPEEFPEPLDVGEPLQAALELSGAVLSEALDLTGRCASIDATRPSLNSIALGSNKGKLVLVGTNSYRLTKIELDVKNDVELNEPLLVHLTTGKAVAKDLRARKAEEVELQLHSQGVAIDYDKVSWRSRRLIGRFPQWEHLIPDQGYNLTLQREELSSVLKAIKAVAAGNAPVRLELGNEIIVRYHSSEIGVLEERLPGSEWDGYKLTVGFSDKYLEDMLRVIEGEEIKGMLTTELRPAYFSSDGRGYLVMPVRTNEITDKDHIVDAEGEAV